MTKRLIQVFSVLSVLLLSVFVSASLAASRPVKQEEIPYGGTFVVGWSTSLSTLKMGQEMCWSLMGCAILSLVYEELAFMGPPPDYDVYVGRLATNWTVSEDLKTWTFYLDPKAKWHDGEPVTAEDVAFTFKYLCNPETGHWVWCSVDTNASKIEVLDEHTVRVTMYQPIAGEVPFWWVPILPKHIWEPYKDNMMAFENTEAIGCGPFMLEEFKPGEYIKLKAFEDYHLGRPYVDYVVLKTYGSEDALVMALLKGEIDMIEPFCLTPSGAMTILKSNAPNVTVRSDPGDMMYWMAVNLKMNATTGGPAAEALKKLDFRKALAYAINKEKMCDVAFMGWADPIDQPIASVLDYYNPNVTKYEYDPDKAASLLDALGYVDTDGDGWRDVDGTPIELKLLGVSTWPAHVKMATCIKEDLEAIGLKVDVVLVDESAYWEVVFTPPEQSGYHLVLFGESVGPNVGFPLEAGLSGGYGNVAGYENPTYDDLYNEFVSEPDRDRRIAICHEMVKILSDDLPFIYLISPRALTAYRTDKFEGWVFGIGGASTWYSRWTYWNIHLKPKPAPAAPARPAWMTWLPWVIAAVVVVAAVVTVIYITRKASGGA